jgi:putative pyruvate formate lyase activating enzyme
MQPVYIKTYKSGELRKKITRFKQILNDCTLCPRKCHVRRTDNELGLCKTGRLAQVASFDLHFGEESPLVGKGGSGAIFFAHCNLGCVFCQNYSISLSDTKFQEVYPNQLAFIMLELQKKGAENINLVTPSHVVAQVVEALPEAIEQGLNLPLVYNTSSYDSLNTLKLLDGVIDIYLADVKFFSSKHSKKYTRATDYPEVAMQAIQEMYAQVGGMVLDARGLVRKGLMVRHLLMPGDIADTDKWLEFLHEHKMHDVYLNIMDQYHPAGRADEFPELMDKITYTQWEKAVTKAQKMGFKYIDPGSSRIFKLLF